MLHGYFSKKKERGKYLNSVTESENLRFRAMYNIRCNVCLNMHMEALALGS